MKTILLEGKFLRLVREGKWEFVERVNASGVVAVIAITFDQRLVLTDQFRPAVGCRVIDLPAGLSGDVKGQEHEAFAESALRELIEETGYTAKRLEHVADCPSSPGLTSEVVSLFVASDLQKMNAGGGVEGEEIEVHTPAIRGIDEWLSKQISAGRLIDGKVFAGLYFARRKSTLSGESAAD
jgi:ADP-ribose pyrophosphatase